jgi:hypothetical protein
MDFEQPVMFWAESFSIMAILYFNNDILMIQSKEYKFLFNNEIINIMT